VYTFIQRERSMHLV